MNIQSVEPHLLSCPLPQPVTYEFYGGRRTIFKRDAMVVCVRGEGGMVGYGPAAASRETANLITHEVAPLLVENDFAILSLWFPWPLPNLVRELWLP